jgi:hypothetical protein
MAKLMEHDLHGNYFYDHTASVAFLMSVVNKEPFNAIQKKTQQTEELKKQES